MAEETQGNNSPKVDQKPEQKRYNKPRSGSRNPQNRNKEGVAPKPG